MRKHNMPLGLLRLRLYIETFRQAEEAEKPEQGHAHACEASSAHHYPPVNGSS